jgi:hypothetical protein
MENKKPITSTLKNLEVGEIASFPIQRMNAVKVTCSNLQKVCGLYFTTKVIKGYIEVTVKDK